MQRSREDLVEISGMEHAFAEETRLESAPQTLQVGRVDDALVKWLHRHLVYGVETRADNRTWPEWATLEN